MLFPTQDRKVLIETARRQRNIGYQLHPAKWYSKRWNAPATDLQWSLHPEYENHVWDGTKDPFLAAVNALSKLKNVGIESATGTGKTYLAASIAFWFLDAFPNSLVITTAPTKQQLEEVLWKEISRFYPKFRGLRKYAKKQILKIRVDSREPELSLDEDKNITHKMLGMVGSKRAGAESDIKFHGHHQKWQLFILEECAGLDEAILTAIENTNIDVGNIALAIGNPDSQLDALHIFCEKQTTTHIRVSAYDHPNIVLKKTVIPGAVTMKSIEERKAEYGVTHPFFLSRVRGIAPEQDKDAMIMNDWIEQCLVGSNKFNENIERDFSHNAVGVDAARSMAGDKAALVWGKANCIVNIQEFQCPSVTHLAYNLFIPGPELDMKYGPDANYHTKKIQDYNIIARHIGVDSVGVGSGTVDTLKDNQYEVISLAGGQVEDALLLDSDGKPFYEFNNLRSQMIWELARDLKSNNIIIWIDDPKLIQQMKKELLVVIYEVKGGKICVESKDEMIKKLGGKSPNILDAMAYWNWVRKNYYEKLHLPFV